MLLDSQVALGYLRQEGFFRSEFEHQKQITTKQPIGYKKHLKVNLRKQKIERNKNKMVGLANLSMCFSFVFSFPFALTDFETLVA